MKATPYDRGFFRSIKGGSVRSARTVVPVVLSLLGPQSVADVGCGTGAWLSVVRELGIDDVLGIDGDYVDRRRLLIPADRFIAADVANGVNVSRRFDVVFSLEVAEHIAPDRSDVYLDNLVKLSDSIVFSAAVPGQRGTGHVNEQWPEYWQERFAARGYRAIDCLRPRFWRDRSVEPWYRQNLFLYVNETVIVQRPELLQEDAGRTLSLVHPALFMEGSFAQVLRLMTGIFVRDLRLKLKKP